MKVIWSKSSSVLPPKFRVRDEDGAPRFRVSLPHRGILIRVTLSVQGFRNLLKLRVVRISSAHQKANCLCVSLIVDQIGGGVVASFRKRPTSTPQSREPGEQNDVLSIMPIGKSTGHLAQLEAESIHIMREVAAQSSKPVMLYSIGKDSSVMLHLAMKAFWPSKPPFPLLHIDTTWKFKEMIAFRDRRAVELGLDLIVHSNQDGLRAGIGPFTHGSAVYTEVMKTEALKQALDKYGFDAALGGARRDEEKSRAKERVFSFRTQAHRWDPRNQRPELWRLYNGRVQKGENIRVFPLSNWTELDVWQYIMIENIPVVPLYFAKERPVVERDRCLIMVDDERMPLLRGRANRTAMGSISHVRLLSSDRRH